MRLGSARWFCYLLTCADGSLYTGITNSLARRPVRLTWVEPCRDRSQASRREAAVKALPRSAKLQLTRDRQAIARLRRAAVPARRPSGLPDRSDGDSAAPAAAAAGRSPRPGATPPRRR